MKLRRWRIDGFGLFLDFEVKELGDGLTLLVGPNEAGKSTMLDFLRWMLFGHHEHRVPALRGQDGGKLWFEVPGGLYKLARVPYRAKGSHVSLTRPDGSLADESELNPLLGHADRAMYESVFAFTQFDLMSFKNLNHDQIRGRLFSAGISGAGSEATAVAMKLDQERSELLSPRRGRLRDLLIELEQVNHRLGAARETAQGYPQAFASVATLRDALATLSRKAEELSQERTNFEHLLALWPTWLEAERARQDLATLPESDDVPDGVEARYAALVQVLSERRGQVEEAEEALRDANVQLRRLSPDAELGGLASEVTRLQSSVEAYRQAQDALQNLNVEHEHLGEEVSKILSELGWSRERVEAFDRSFPVREEVRALSVQIAGAIAGLGEIQREAREFEALNVAGLAQLEQAIQSLAEHNEPPAAESLERRGHALRTLRGQLIERDRLIGRHDSLAQSARDLEEAHSSWLQAKAALGAVPIGPNTDQLDQNAGSLRRLRADIVELNRTALRVENLLDTATALAEADRECRASEEILRGPGARSADAIVDRRSALRRARSRLADVLRARDQVKSAALRAEESEADVRRLESLGLPPWAPIAACGLAIVVLLMAGWAHGAGNVDLRNAAALLGVFGILLAVAIFSWQKRHANDLTDRIRRAKEAKIALGKAENELQPLELELSKECATLGLVGGPGIATLDDVEASLDADRELRLQEDHAIAARQGAVERFSTLLARAGHASEAKDAFARAVAISEVSRQAVVVREEASALQLKISTLAEQIGLEVGLTANQLDEAERILAEHRKLAADRELALAAVAHAQRQFVNLARTRGIALDVSREDFGNEANAALAAAVMAQETAQAKVSAKEEEMLRSAKEQGFAALPEPLDLEEAFADLALNLDGRREHDARVAAVAKARQIHDAADKAFEQARIALAVATASQYDRQGEWTAWKADRGLPPALSCEGAIEFCDRIKEAQDKILVIARTAGRLTDAKERCSQFEDRVRACLESACEPPGETPDDLLDALMRLTERVKADQEVRRSRQEAERLLERLDEQIVGRNKAQEEAASELQMLFGGVGVADAASFTEKVKATGRRRELLHLSQSIAARMAERIGTDEYALRLKEQLEAGEKSRWELGLADIRTRLTAVVAERDTLAGDLRDAERALAELEASSDVQRIEFELAAIVRKVREASHRFRLISYSQRLIIDTLKRFERERQPAVLKRASEYLRALTGGVYDQLTIESERHLIVSDSRESRYDPEVFSVGTKQQLYTSLRLALAENLAENGTDLPLIMDDVLINFDPERAREMAGLLRHFVERRQVLVFTCHPATADLLKKAVPDAGLIELPRYAGAGVPIGAGVRSSRVSQASR